MTAIQMYDTTLRDGAQGEGVSFSLVDKLQIACRLDEIGIDIIEGGYPLSNEKDADFFRLIRKENLSHAVVTAFGMTRRRGVKPAQDPGMIALLRAETAACTIVGKTWDLHALEVLRVSLEENTAMIASSIWCRKADRSSMTPSISLMAGRPTRPTRRKRSSRRPRRARR